ncbi:MAG: DUF47 family protein [Ferrimicrobium sp.]|jgi:uncharacterized protein Yka (UPF0111/DUF47 family)|nr:DUF47 family protein [Ferrimicrobium sp.]
MSAERSLWRRFIAFLQSFGPRASKELVGNLVAHLGADADGVALVLEMLQGRIDYQTAVVSMSGIEHRGDQLRTELVTTLARTLVTPLDREDIYRFSRSIDDLLDELRDFVREWDLLQGVDPEPLVHVVTALGAAIADAKVVVNTIGEPTGTESSQLRQALRSANQVRRIHEDEITALFAGDGEVSMELLRERELLHRLDAVGLHLVQGLNTIADSFVKRGE